MRKFLALVFIWCGHLAADSLDIRVDPKDPVLDENFKVIFEIKTQDGTDPVINFDPLGIEVIGRGETAVRTRTTYINGKLSTERTLTVAYEMLAKRRGSVFLRDISVDLNGNTLKHKTIRLNVLTAPRKARDILVRAEVDKEEAFVGESVLVRYYLYNKVPVVSTDVRRFPKLEKFLKRYHQEKVAAERVRLNGEIYTRRVIYTAQLFAEKPGDYKIDPIRLSIQYSQRGASAFDSFGFGSRFGGTRRKTLSSKPIELKIKALPVQNVPPSFTGLVGKHDFKLELNKNRFVVNEPIELKLRVTGKGALELYEAPKVFTESGIEEFETSADLMIREDFTASKTFLYTYLGREGMNLENKIIPFTYFDPDALKFVTENVSLGEIAIAGTSSPMARVEKDRDNKASSESKPAPKQAVPKKYFEPIYKLAGTYAYNKVVVALILGVLFFVGLLYVFRDFLLSLGRSKPGLIAEIGKQGLNYSRLHQVVNKLGQGRDMRDTVEKSGLSRPAKSYLLKVIDTCESEYQKNGSSRNHRIPKRVLREISTVAGER